MFKFDFSFLQNRSVGFIFAMEFAVLKKKPPPLPGEAFAHQVRLRRCCPLEKCEMREYRSTEGFLFHVSFTQYASA